MRTDMCKKSLKLYGNTTTNTTTTTTDKKNMDLPVIGVLTSMCHCANIF